MKPGDSSPPPPPHFSLGTLLTAVALGLLLAAAVAVAVWANTDRPAVTLIATLSAGAAIWGLSYILHPNRPSPTTPIETFLHERVRRQQHTIVAQRRLLNRQSALNELLATTNKQQSPQKLITTAVKRIMALTDWSVTILTTDDDGRLSIAASAGHLEPNLPDDWTAPAEHPATTALHTGEVGHLPADTRPSGVRRHVDAQAALYVPLKRGPLSMGVLMVSDTVSTFTTDDILLAESLAESLALGLENAYLFQELSDQRGRLEALIDSTVDGIMLIGSGNRILVINETLTQILALPQPQPTCWEGRPLSDLETAIGDSVPAFAHDLSTRFTHSTKSALSSPTGPEMMLQGKYYRPFYRRVNTDEQTPIGWLCVLRDITEQERTAQMQRDIAHTMVHDLRNPLHMIMGAVGLLETELKTAGLDSSNAAQLVSITQTNANKMVNLVNAILDISRLESGRLPVTPEPLSPAQIIHHTFNGVHLMAQEKEITLTADLPNHMPPLWADEQLLERVMQNLVDNALKFTPRRGSVTVRVRPAPTEEPADSDQIDRYEVAVIDSGPGIPAALEDHLFQKFTSGAHHQSGSGLGLAFCRMALEAHGERIWVADTGPDGTTFAFTLPTRPAQLNG